LVALPTGHREARRRAVAHGLGALLQREASSACRSRVNAALAFVHPNSFQESSMGKYFLAWILGVPAVVLVGIYLVAHL
jgi:hypothetical protein